MALTPATFPAALKAAVSGSVLTLGPGAYGDLAIRSRTFAEPVRIVAENPADPPIFNTLRAVGVEGLALEGVKVAFAPTLTTYEHQNIASIEGSKRITLSGCKITAGMAINGVPETSTVYGAYGNIIGWPLGRGVFLALSSDVEISDCEIWGVQRGLLTYKSNGVRFLKNHVHDVRRTFILGDANNLTIAGNYLYGSKPWRWGQTPIGDHGDFIAIFPSSLGPMTKVSITNNVCEQRAGGTAILGITLASIRQLEVKNNILRGTDHQGLVTTDVLDGVLTDNVLTGRAGILLRVGTERVAVSGNVATYYEDRLKGLTGNTLSNPRVLALDTVMPGGVRLILTTNA